MCSRKGLHMRTWKMFWQAYGQMIIRVIHSLSGLAFALFLCEHLTTNISAASYFHNGSRFVEAVQALHRIPGLKVIEVVCLAIPFGLHALLGIGYLLQSHHNVWSFSGNRPSLPYAKNIAYSLQRLTAWILLFGLIFHIVQFRFIRYPIHMKIQNQEYYAVTFQDKRFDVVTQGLTHFFTLNFDHSQQAVPAIDQNDIQEIHGQLKAGKAYLLTPNVGEAFLCIIRDALGCFWIALFYSVLVLAGSFHGFNGLWTFLSRWGFVASKYRSLGARYLCCGLMLVISLMTLSTVWNLYLG